MMAHQSNSSLQLLIVTVFMRVSSTSQAVPLAHINCKLCQSPDVRQKLHRHKTSTHSTLRHSFALRHSLGRSCTVRTKSMAAPAEERQKTFDDKARVSACVTQCKTRARGDGREAEGEELPLPARASLPPASPSSAHLLPCARGRHAGLKT